MKDEGGREEPKAEGASSVAQNCILPYRRVALCESPKSTGPSSLPGVRRLQIGDTEECNFALPFCARDRRGKEKWNNKFFLSKQLAMAVSNGI